MKKLLIGLILCLAWGSLAYAGGPAPSVQTPYTLAFVIHMRGGKFYADPPPPAPNPSNASQALVSAWTAANNAGYGGALEIYALGSPTQTYTTGLPSNGDQAVSCASTLGAWCTANTAGYGGALAVYCVNGCSGGGGSPGGSNTQVQFNNSSNFGGSANLTWVSPTLTIGASGTAGSLVEYNNTATTTWGSSATTSNTVKGPATVPSTTDLLSCTTVSTTCTLTDTGMTASGGTLTATTFAGALSGNAATATAPASPPWSIANGGTNGTTATAALNSLFGAATRAGDLLYCSTYSSGCTAWALLPGNTTATNFLSENSSGVPSWVTGAVLWSGLGSTTSALNINTGTTVLNSNGTLSGTSNFFTLNGNASDTCSGTCYMESINVPSGSGVGAAQLQFNSKGIVVDKSGNVDMTSANSVKVTGTSGHLAGFTSSNVLGDSGAVTANLVTISGGAAFSATANAWFGTTDTVCDTATVEAGFICPLGASSTTQTFFAHYFQSPGALTTTSIDGNAAHVGVRLSYGWASTQNGSNWTLNLYACSAWASATSCTSAAQLTNNTSTAPANNSTYASNMFDCEMYPSGAAGSILLNCNRGAGQPNAAINAVPITVPASSTGWVVVPAVTWATASQNDSLFALESFHWSWICASGVPVC